MSNNVTPSRSLLSRSMRRAYPMEVRQRAVGLHREGLGAKRIGRTLGIDESVIKEWLRRYRAYGEDSLRPWWRAGTRRRQDEAALPGQPCGTDLSGSENAADAPSSAGPSETRAAAQGERMSELQGRPGPRASVPVHEKYREALRLFVSSNLSRVEICRRCGVTYGGFTSYLQRYHSRYLESGRQRRRNAFQMARMKSSRKKYRRSLRLYATTDLTYREICARTGVSVSGFGRFVRTYHRDLLARRNSFEVSRREADVLRLRRNGTGQSLRSHLKYAEAIAACGEERYLAYNVSQIAHAFHVDANSLAGQLRTHYPEVLRMRERERLLRGLGDNLHRGARETSTECYSGAVELLRTGGLTIRQAAETCGVSASGLRMHLTQYHRDVVEQRAERRRAEPRPSVGPKETTEARYRESVELYRTTSLTAVEVASRTGVNVNSFRRYLSQWHRGLLLERRGVTEEELASGASRPKPYLKSTAAKYAPAIRELRESGGTMSSVASAHGLDAENFRRYLREHEPDLAERCGRRQLENGRKVLSRSAEKYAEAVRQYEKTGEDLKSVAHRLGLNYTSLYGFIRRNYPDLAARRKTPGK